MSLNDIIVGIQNGITTGGGNSGRLVFAIGLVLLVLLIVGIASYVFYLMSARGRLDMLLDSRTVRRGNPWPTRVLVLIIVIAIPLGVHVSNTQPSTCSACHGDAIHKRLATSVHAEVNCIDCHGAQGIMAPFTNTVTYASWSWAYYVEGRRPTTASTFQAQVSASKCLDCHKSITSGVTEVGGIRVRHSDFLKPSVSCEECHGNVVHSSATNVTRPSMNQCLPCHDGKIASADCIVCHKKDVTQTKTAAAQMQKNKITTVMRWDSCYACHEPKPCLTCHGVMMPHPPGWGPNIDRQGRYVSTPTAGTHPNAGFTRRDLCWRCHFAPGRAFQPSNEGCACHGFLGTIHGGQPWVAEHGLEASGKKGGKLANCAACHVMSGFCGHCHEASEAIAAYKPHATNDYTYTRIYTPTPIEQFMIDNM
jgi:hypothetical protein